MISEQSGEEIELSSFTSTIRLYIEDAATYLTIKEAEELNKHLTLFINELKEKQ